MDELNLPLAIGLVGLKLSSDRSYEELVERILPERASIEEVPYKPRCFRDRHSLTYEAPERRMSSRRYGSIQPKAIFRHQLFAWGKSHVERLQEMNINFNDESTFRINPSVRPLALCQVLKLLMKAENSTRINNLVQLFTKSIIIRIRTSKSAQVSVVRLVTEASQSIIQSEPGITKHVEFKFKCIQELHVALLDLLSQETNAQTLEYCLSTIGRLVQLSRNGHARDKSNTISKVIDENRRIFNRSKGINKSYLTRIDSKNLLSLLILHNIHLIHRLSRKRNKVLLAMLISYNKPRFLRYYNTLRSSKEVNSWPKLLN